MKNLLLTTMLVSAFAAAPPLMAQTADPAAPGTSMTTPEIMAPEGFVRQEVTLTAEDLLGATIYDATGASIGDVHDLVLDVTAAGGNMPAGKGAADGGSTGSDMSGSNTEGGNTMTGTGMSPGGTTAGEATTGAAITGGAAPADTAPDGTTTADPTAPATGDTTAGAAGDASGSTVTDPASGMADTSATAPTGQAAQSTTGQATHAVLDIGGFLGMGEHRVAVPITDLAIYRSDSETRVYLPWSREQLEALPVYVEDDSATLGRSAMPEAQ